MFKLWQQLERQMHNHVLLWHGHIHFDRHSSSVKNCFFCFRCLIKMYSRAHLLVEREYEKFKKESPWVCYFYMFWIHQISTESWSDDKKLLTVKVNMHLFYIFFFHLTDHGLIRVLTAEWLGQIHESLTLVMSCSLTVRWIDKPERFFHISWMSFFC